jgi:nitrate/nitrite transporter NarK
MLILTVSGFVVSMVLHILSITQLYEPTKAVSFIVTVVGFLLVYVAVFISKRKCSQANPDTFRQELFNMCPKWISTGVGIFVLYAIVGLVYYAIHRYSGRSLSPPEKAGIRGFTGHWMALYAVAFLILYSCKKYIKSNKSAPEID